MPAEDVALQQSTTEQLPPDPEADTEPDPAISAEAALIFVNEALDHIEANRLTRPEGNNAADLHWMEMEMGCRVSHCADKCWPAPGRIQLPTVKAILSTCSHKLESI